MEIDTIANMAFVAFVGAGLATLLWQSLGRLEGRIEKRFDAIDRRFEAMQAEISALRPTLRRSLWPWA